MSEKTGTLSMDNRHTLERATGKPLGERTAKITLTLTNLDSLMNRVRNEERKRKLPPSIFERVFGERYGLFK